MIRNRWKYRGIWGFVSVVVFVGGLVALYPLSEVRADGCAFPKKSAASLEVTATKQRALVWLRDGTWEVHIQPVFDREQGQAAWVVPFPSLPEVHEGSADLFYHLEIVTSPVFIEYCYESSDGGSTGCGVSADSSGGKGDGQKSAAQSSVNVWAQGQVGALDYVVLSADDGDDLVGWLEDHDYSLPQGSADLIADFEVEGQYFFVAQLSEEADPEEANAPVRFVLPEEEDGFYPLRLTSLAVQGAQRLALTLFFVFPEVGGQGFLPSSHPYEQVTWNLPNREAFDAKKDEFFSEHSADTLLMLFGRNLGNTDALDTQRCVSPHSYEPQLCVTYDDLNVDVPSQWDERLLEMESDGAWLYRFEGHLDGEAMSEDLVLGPKAAENLPALINLYTYNVGSCPTDDGDDYVACSVSNQEVPSGWFIIGLMVVCALFLIRKKRS